jgi:hypothetical protein
MKQIVATVVLDSAQVTESAQYGIWTTSIDRGLKVRGYREGRKDTLPAGSTDRWMVRRRFTGQPAFRPPEGDHSE